MSTKEKVTRVTYYSYYIEDIVKKERYLHNINDFLQIFCNIDNIKYKKMFIYNDEYYYIVPIDVKDKSKKIFYYFISTKNNDIGKVIEESKNIQVSDIESKLSVNQMLGFTSYIMIMDRYIAFSASNISPKYTAFENFINTIFQTLNINQQYRFIMTPFPLEITANEALNFAFIGKTSLKIKSTSTIGMNLFKLLNKNGSSNSIDGYEIVVKPKRKQDITNLGKDILMSAINENPNDIQRVTLRAKMNLTDDLQEYIVFTNSKIKDTIKSVGDMDRCNQMYDLSQKNTLLQEELNEINNSFKNQNFKGLDDFTNINTWYNRIPNL